MCRLFGFRSVIKGQVHRSLVGADNALRIQSEKNPDGWGVAHYILGVPHVVRSVHTALTDQLFQRVSAVVHSETVLAHVRKATVGTEHILNTHPFQFGPWVFAHNGNIKNFTNHRNQLVQLIEPDLRRFILGETDSEVMFYFILSHLHRSMNLHHPISNFPKIIEAVSQAIKELISIVGPYELKDEAPPSETFLTFMLTNGESLVAFQGGKHLHYSTHKGRCPERDTCKSFDPICERKVQANEKVNHLIVSSEILQGENVWELLNPGELVGVDGKMQFFRGKI